MRKEWLVSNKNSCVESQTSAYLNPILIPDDYKYLNDACKTCLYTFNFLVFFSTYTCKVAIYLRNIIE